MLSLATRVIPANTTKSGGGTVPLGQVCFFGRSTGTARAEAIGLREWADGAPDALGLHVELNALYRILP